MFQEYRRSHSPINRPYRSYLPKEVPLLRKRNTLPGCCTRINLNLRLAVYGRYSDSIAQCRLREAPATGYITNRFRRGSIQDVALPPLKSTSRRWYRLCVPHYLSTHRELHTFCHTSRNIDCNNLRLLQFLRPGRPNTCGWLSSFATAGRTSRLSLHLSQDRICNTGYYSAAVTGWTGRFTAIILCSASVTFGTCYVLLWPLSSFQHRWRYLSR